MNREKRLPPLPRPLDEMAREGRLPHSICLEGEPGSGRTALAMALAGAVLCERSQGEMCGECLSCRKVLAGAHSDVILVNGREEPERFKVEPLRELRASAYVGPSEGRAKVFILAEAQLLLRDAQSILLKVIEEPPEDTCFILTCDNKFRLLPTILSRVTTVPLRPLTVADCAALLGERYPKKGAEECREAALLAAGAPGEGERILTHPQTAKRARDARCLIEALTARDAYRAIAAAVPHEKTRQEYTLFLEAALRLSMLPELREELGLSPGRAALLHRRFQEAAEQNRMYGYLPLLTSLLCRMTRE